MWIWISFWMVYTVLVVGWWGDTAGWPLSNLPWSWAVAEGFFYVWCCRFQYHKDGTLVSWGLSELWIFPLLISLQTFVLQDATWQNLTNVGIFDSPILPNCFSTEPLHSLFTRCCVKFRLKKCPQDGQVGIFQILWDEHVIETWCFNRNKQVLLVSIKISVLHCAIY